MEPWCYSFLENFIFKSSGKNQSNEHGTREMAASPACLSYLLQSQAGGSWWLPWCSTITSDTWLAVRGVLAGQSPSCLPWSCVLQRVTSFTFFPELPPKARLHFPLSGFGYLGGCHRTVFQDAWAGHNLNLCQSVFKNPWRYLNMNLILRITSRPPVVLKYKILIFK